MKDNIGLKGKWRIEVLNSEGALKDTKEFTNIITNAGKAEVAGLILTDVTSTNDFDYLALGTSNTAPAAAQTALVAEVYRTGGTGTRTTTAETNDTAQLSGSFSITASNTLQECGILNSSSTGVLLARTTYSAISVESGDTVNAVYKVQVS